MYEEIVMRPTFRIIVISSIIFFSTHAAAGALQCIGMDLKGNTIHLILDTESSTLNINGNILKVTGVIMGNKGVATQNFISNSGVVVYDAMVFLDPPDALFYQYNASTSDVLGQASLACHMN